MSLEVLGFLVLGARVVAVFAIVIAGQYRFPREAIPERLLSIGRGLLTSPLVALIPARTCYSSPSNCGPLNLTGITLHAAT
jgi:hypothetical protein